jgi:hypothetical protein
MSEIEFLKVIKILQASYLKDFDEDTIKIWYIQFKDIKYNILLNAVTSIVRKNKYMPSISEILEECDNASNKVKYDILEKMKKSNYFKSSLEYEKANNWLEKNIIPEWFKNDMKLYINKQIGVNIKELQ